MPLIDPVYRIRPNRYDGVRRSWDPSGELGLQLEHIPAQVTITGQEHSLDQGEPAGLTLEHLPAQVTIEGQRHAILRTGVEWLEAPDIQFTLGIPGARDLNNYITGTAVGWGMALAPEGVTIDPETGIVYYDGSGDEPLDFTNTQFHVADNAEDADFLARATGPGVVWWHAFRSDAEVDNFRWTSGFGGGNDPLAVGDELAGNCRRITTDPGAPEGCLEMLRPEGDDEIPAWWRMFSPLKGSGNGRGIDDPGANGTIPPQDYTPTSGGSQIANWHANASRPGFYGHSSYHVGTTFDGTEFYLQVRFKADPRRTEAGNPQVGKSHWFTLTAKSLTAQEIVVYSGAFSQAGGPNYHRVYVAGGPPLEQLDSLGRPGQQVGSDLANYGAGTYCHISSQPGNCWAYSGGWDTFLYHIAPGRQGVEETRFICYAAHEGETSYTKIWDVTYAMSFEESWAEGLNSFRPAVYNNGNFVSEFWNRYKEMIFSKEFIPCPQV